MNIPAAVRALSEYQSVYPDKEAALVALLSDLQYWAAGNGLDYRDCELQAGYAYQLTPFDPAKVAELRSKL